MTNSAQHRNWTLKVGSRPASGALTMAVLFALTLVAIPSAQAQSFTVLHSFTGGADGASPAAGLTLDKAGNLYGTASAGGAGYGTVFKLTHSGTGWIVNPLYQFQGGADGATPVAALVFGPDGGLYGTTQLGGNNICQYVGGETGCGTVFNLKPPPNRPKSFSNPWVETVIYRFGFWTDGSDPYSEVIFDAAGNLYGTTASGGENNDYARIDGGGGGCGNHCGVVYELSPSGGGWTESTIFQFTQETGSNPQGRSDAAIRLGTWTELRAMRGRRAWARFSSCSAQAPGGSRRHRTRCNGQTERTPTPRRFSMHPAIYTAAIRATAVITEDMMATSLF